jgi:SOS-response transcriptional repressor LexA
MLRFIARFTQENGFPPTHREMQDEFNISSLAVMNYRIHRMIELGYITQRPGQPRTIVLTREGKEIMKIHKSTVEEAASEWAQLNMKNSLL